MLSIAFDLVVADTEKHHPKGVNRAYADIDSILTRFDFYRVQGGLYICKKEDMANLFDAINALKEMDWFKNSVRDIRGFRIDNWSNFTKSIKS